MARGRRAGCRCCGRSRGGRRRGAGVGLAQRAQRRGWRRRCSRPGGGLRRRSRHRWLRATAGWPASSVRMPHQRPSRAGSVRRSTAPGAPGPSASPSRATSVSGSRASPRWEPRPRSCRPSASPPRPPTSASRSPGHPRPRPRVLASDGLEARRRRSPGSPGRRSPRAAARRSRRTGHHRLLAQRHRCPRGRGRRRCGRRSGSRCARHDGAVGGRADRSCRCLGVVRAVRRGWRRARARLARGRRQPDERGVGAALPRPSRRSVRAGHPSALQVRRRGTRRPGRRAGIARRAQPGARDSRRPALGPLGRHLSPVAARPPARSAPAGGIRRRGRQRLVRAGRRRWPFPLRRRSTPRCRWRLWCPIRWHRPPSTTRRAGSS